MNRSGMVRHRSITFTIALAGACGTHAQYGGVDPSFNPLDDGAFGAGFQYTDPFYAWDAPSPHRIGLSATGDLIVSGKFDRYNCHPTNHVVRMDMAGRVDISFSTPIHQHTPVTDMAVLPDGRMIVVGNTMGMDGLVVKGAARLLQDGSTDPVFLAGTEATGNVSRVAFWPDGSIVVAGSFTSYQGVPRGRVAKLHPNGALDMDYATGIAVTEGVVLDILPLADGSLLMAGSFTSYDGHPVGRIIRLDAYGQRDPSFEAFANGTVTAIAASLDGSLWIGGQFSIVNDVPMPRLARLQSHGGLVPEFASPLVPPGSIVRIRALPDGSAYIAGTLNLPAGGPPARIARIDPIGDVDPTFQPIVQEFLVNDMLPLPDDRLAVCGYFNQWEGQPRSCMVVLHADGSLDTGHNPARGASGKVHSIASLPDGRLVIGGTFRAFNDTLVQRLAMLGPNGGLQHIGSWGSGASNTVNKVVVDAQGRILLGGYFQSIHGVPANCIARLLPSGGVDPGFLSGSGTSQVVYDIMVDDKGRILIGGLFGLYNGTYTPRIARLMPDGTLDPSFDPGTGVPAGGTIQSLGLLPEGKILAGGNFHMYNGTTTHNLVRLLPNGSRDPDVHHPAVTGMVRAIAVQPDGAALVGGYFQHVDMLPVPYLFRTLPDGTRDMTFDIGTGPDLYVETIALDQDGKILVGGWFSSFDGLPYSGLVRLHPNGSVDTTFPVNGLGPYSTRRTVHAITVLPENEILLGGSICTYSGQLRHGILRLTGNATTGVSDRTATGTTTLFPNPTSGMLHFGRDLSGSIHDVQGRMVMQVPPGDRISVQALAHGVYLLRTDEGQVMRFVRE
ncbi:MAG: hypothetical protein KIT10_08875 [Flavobacteriales bacterium]|nr:hypothetical protein [Flavobacteriales bacterium]